MYTIEGSSGCVKKLSFCEEKIRIKPCINGENSIQFYLSAVFLLPEKRRYALKRKIGLSSQILIGLVLGALVGYLFPDFGDKLKPFGDAFLRMIKMIVVPLIFSTLVMGIAGTGDFKKLGRLGGKAIIWFEFATTIALAIGLLFMNIAEPGVGVTLSASAANASNAAAASQHSVDLVDYAVHIIPTNIVDAMARQDMLQIIFFACFFGVAVAHIGGKGETIVDIYLQSDGLCHALRPYRRLCHDCLYRWQLWHCHAYPFGEAHPVRCLCYGSVHLCRRPHCQRLYGYQFLPRHPGLEGHPLPGFLDSQQ